MADATHGSIYDGYWHLIRDYRWKRNQPENPKNVIEIEAPADTHRKIIKAIRNRKALEQVAKGRNYGKLLATSVTVTDDSGRQVDIIRLILQTPEHERI